MSLLKICLRAFLLSFPTPSRLEISLALMGRYEGFFINFNISSELGNFMLDMMKSLPHFVFKLPCHKLKYGVFRGFPTVEHQADLLGYRHIYAKALRKLSCRKRGLYALRNHSHIREYIFEFFAFSNPQSDLSISAKFSGACKNQVSNTGKPKKSHRTCPHFHSEPCDLGKPSCDKSRF